MQRLFCGLAALPFLASVALAGQPVTLNDPQIGWRHRRCGWDVRRPQLFPGNPGAASRLTVCCCFFSTKPTAPTRGRSSSMKSPVPCSACYLNNTGTENLVVQAAFGPISAQVTSADTRVLESWRIPPPVTAASRIPGLASGTPNLCGAVGATTYSIVSRV